MTTKTTAKGSSCLAKLVAAIFVIMLVLTLPLALFLFNFGRVFFNPPAVTHVVTNELVNSDLLPVVLEWFSDSRAQERVETGEAHTWVDEPDIVQLMAFVDRDAWRKIKAEVLTDEMINEWVPALVNGLYAWIDSDAVLPQVELDLRKLKAIVDSEHGRNSIVIAYDQLPPCTTEQIDDFKSRLNAAPPDTEVFYNLCEFPNPWHDDQVNDYLQSLNDLVDSTPEDFALGRAIDDSSNTSASLAVVKQQLLMLRFLYRWGWIVPLICLLLILALVIRSLHSLGIWWGAPLLLSGLLGVLLGLLYRLAIGWLFNSQLLSLVPELARPQVVSSASRLAGGMFRPMLIEAIIIAVAGLIIVAVGAFVGPESREDPAAADGQVNV